MAKTLYTEEQKFKHPWIWLVIFPAISLLIYFTSYYSEDGGFNLKEEDDQVGMIILAVVFFIMMTGLTIIFYMMRLTTHIKSDGIYLKYPPMVNKERVISKKKIIDFKVRKYHPNKEFRGHGVKKGIFKSSRSYTVSGRLGLQLNLKDGQSILIGTQRKEAIISAMQKMMMARTNNGSSLIK